MKFRKINQKIFFFWSFSALRFERLQLRSCGCSVFTHTTHVLPDPTTKICCFNDEQTGGFGVYKSLRAKWSRQVFLGFVVHKMCQFFGVNMNSRSHVHTPNHINHCSVDWKRPDVVARFDRRRRQWRLMLIAMKNLPLPEILFRFNCDEARNVEFIRPWEMINKTNMNSICSAIDRQTNQQTLESPSRTSLIRLGSKCVRRSFCGLSI